MADTVIDDDDIKPVIILQPFWHFFTLSLVSCGLYSMIWAYGIWAQLRNDNEMHNDKVLNVILHPIVRVVFDWLFSFSLYRHVTNAAIKQKVLVDYSPFLFAAAFSFLRIFSQQLAFPWFMLIFIFWVPYIPLFFTYRKYLEAKEAVCIYRSRLRLWEIILLVLGVYGSMGILTMAFNPELLRQVQEMYGITK
ncbi:MAG: hypothetical protein OCD01_13970 [Fibrobacterales bacterium]